MEEALDLSFDRLLMMMKHTQIYIYIYIYIYILYIIKINPFVKKIQNYRNKCVQHVKRMDRYRVPNLIMK